MSAPPEEAAEADAELAFEQAKLAASRGDLNGAVRHVADALAFDPMRGEWLELLEQISRAAEDPPALAPLESETPFALAAARAYLLVRAGRLADGLPLLLTVAAVQPEVPYLSWAMGWLGPPEAGPSLTPEALASILGAPLTGFLRNLPELVLPDDPTFPNLDALSVALELLERAHPDHVPRLLAHASVTRRLGRLDEALDSARQAAEITPHPLVLTQLANVHRARGELDETISAYERALSDAPDELTIRLDLGDTLLEHGRPADAATHYERVLMREPEHGWALPSLWAARAIATGEPSWRERLVELAERKPDNVRAVTLLSSLDARDRAH